MTYSEQKAADGGWFAHFLFAVRGAPTEDGVFIAITSDRSVIRKARAQLELPKEQRNLHINGSIALNNGGHNLDWSWHFTPDEWDLVETSMELCDGTPQMVEEDLDYWVNTVKRFCPWSSFVLYELQQQ